VFGLGAISSNRDLKLNREKISAMMNKTIDNEIDLQKEALKLERRNRISAFLKILSSHNKLLEETCTVDGYLIAMAYIYLERAQIPPNNYTSDHFLEALWLATSKKLSLRIVFIL
jgi:hypothetical protein